MSHRAIAAALALGDVSGSERLAAFSLASFANRAEQAWPGNRVAAARAGLSRSQYLEARGRLAGRGLISIEAEGGGRGNSTLITLNFAERGPRLDVELNAELFELVLGYTRNRGSARQLLSTLAAVADSMGTVAGVTTDELCARAGLPDRSYRRARAQLLSNGDVQLEDAGGGRARTNRWRIRDPRLIGQPLTAITARPSRAAGSGPLVAQVQADERHPRQHVPIAASAVARTRPRDEGSAKNPGQSRTVPRGNPGQSRTVSAKTPANPGLFRSKTPAQTPAQTPAPSARTGREPQNLRTTPPDPPEGGIKLATIEVEEHYVSSGGRRRRRTVSVDLEQVRRRFQPPTSADHDDWRRIRSLLMGAVSESVYAIWFEPLQLVATDQAGMLIVAGDPGICGWVRDRFGALLADCAGRAGRPLRVADGPEHQALTGALTSDQVQINHQEVS